MNIVKGMKMIHLDDAIEAIASRDETDGTYNVFSGRQVVDILKGLPSAQLDIIRCKDCKWWRQQINYQGNPLSFNPLPFGCCESDDMWRSLCGETYEVSQIDTDEDFYCGYAQLRGERDEID